MIKNPGRMYLQVGYDEIYRCIQSGYSGADYVPTKTYMPDEEITVQMTDNTANPIHSAKIELSGEKSDKHSWKPLLRRSWHSDRKRCCCETFVAGYASRKIALRTCNREKGPVMQPLVWWTMFGPRNRSRL